MNLENYERHGQMLYAEFSAVVASILAAAVRADVRLRLQQVQSRAKHLSSLQKKLRLREAPHEDIEQSVKDLAGCRLIFYTNSDVRRFMSSGIVNDNFEIDWDRSKIHHPDGDARSASELFIADNLVVRLNDARTKLPEYAGFAGLWCEVQVQTTLNHAWSEMSHDIIYKKPVLAGFGGRLMRGIDERLTRIMRDYLQPAGYEFQKVADDFERLSMGKELFDRGALETLAACTDNNARYDVLQRFSSYVLPSYDDIDSVHGEVRSALVRVIERARDTRDHPFETSLGAAEGHTAEMVIDEALVIIDRLKYADVDATFEAVCRVYVGATNDQQRKRTLQSVASLAKNELQSWKQSGAVVQQILVARLTRLTPAELQSIMPVALEILRHVLDPSVRGSTSTFDQITLHTGSVIASDSVRALRRSVIDLLRRMFRQAGTDQERRATIDALQVGTETPQSRAYPDGVLSMILDNTREIVCFYVDLAETASFELRQKLEHDVFWYYRRNREVSAEASSDPDVLEARRLLIVAALEFRDRANRDPDFRVYKTLVGYDSIFPPAWDDQDFDWQAQERYREERIAEFVQEVTDANSDRWLAMMARCAQTESNDLATFPKFGRFLEQLGREKPSIVLSYLDRLDDRLARFLPSILSGLEGSNHADEVPPIIGRWIAERRYLSHLIWHQRFTERFSLKSLVDALFTAVEMNDTNAVRNAVSAAVQQQGKVRDDLIDSVFLPAIRYLDAFVDQHWTSAIRLQDPNAAMFTALSAGQVDQVLQTLVRLPSIEHNIDELLAAMAESWPEKVIEFFGVRLREEKAARSGFRYSPVPLRFYNLSAPLARAGAALVAAMRRWFEEDRTLFAYRGGQLFSKVFRELSPEVASNLSAIVARADRNDVEFIVELLRGYEEGSSTLDVCKSVVAVLPLDDELLVRVDVLLDATGVVRGNFGFVEACKQKRGEIESWLTDERERVRAFAERRLRRLDRQIAAEQRRSEQDLELRKRGFGSPGGG